MTDHPLVVDLFAAAGLVAHESGLLPDALAELAVRLDIKGAGPLLTLITETCWTAHEDVCPTCGGKRDPQPHPKPPKPPEPPKGPSQ